MTAPHDDRQPPPPGQWQPPPPGYAPPPGSAPPPGYAPPPPPGQPPPGSPPPAPAPASQQRDRGGVIAGFVVIVIGLFFLLAQLVPDIGRYIVLFIGLVFLAAFLAKREYGFLVAGSIISGVGVGVVLADSVADQWAGTAVLLSIAGGFLAIWLVSTLLHAADHDWPGGESREAAKALWWPLIPGGILTIIGIVVLAEEGVESDLLRWWPVLLIGAGVIVLISALTRDRRGRTP